MSDHEHDEQGNCLPPEGGGGFYQVALPTWRFSPWDVAGISTTLVAGLFTVTGQGLNLLAREFAAMANYSRQERELRLAQEAYDADQAAGAEALRLLVEGSPVEES